MDKRIADIDTLKSHTSAWTVDRNKKGASANWQFTTDDARVKLRRLYPSIDD